MTERPASEAQRIAIVGAGWNGSHLALSFSRRGYDVTLFERQPRIFSDISGKFGIRIHAGPHYPRSVATRKTCHRGFHKFCDVYPELVNWHKHAFYLLAKSESIESISKVDEMIFRNVCEEFQCKSEIDPASYSFNPHNTAVAYDLNEPSAVLGVRLRQFFEKKLQENNIKVKCNSFITRIDKLQDKHFIQCGDAVEAFDHVINTTSYKYLLPNKALLPFNIDIVYQPCLALVYEDLMPDNKPISFIVMDGWFPCLMPYDDRESIAQPFDRYIMTHGKWTIMGSYDSLHKANKALARINSQFVNANVRAPSEAHMNSFWPDFEKRFRYKGYKAVVLAKIKTNQEFRGAVVFQDSESDIINVFPGKITNIFDAEQECEALVNRRDIVNSKEGCRYVKDGVLADAAGEISEMIVDRQHATCELQTFRELLDDSVPAMV